MKSFEKLVFHHDHGGKRRTRRVENVGGTMEIVSVNGGVVSLRMRTAD